MLEIKVHPKARRNAVAALDTDLYEVWTTAAPEHGAANAAVLRLLAGHLGVAPSRLTLVRGAAARRKFVELSGQ